MYYLNVQAEVDLKSFLIVLLEAVQRSKLTQITELKESICKQTKSKWKPLTATESHSRAAVQYETQTSRAEKQVVRENSLTELMNE